MRQSRDLGLAVLLLFSASVFLSAIRAARAQQETDEEEEFSYSLDAENGPAHWGDIKEEWSACGKGNMQSPIDLASPRVSLVRGLGYLNHSYVPANATIVNRGHDIMLKFESDAGSVSIGGTPYFLRQLQWHSPTEHSVNGRRYDMELHMFHESAQGKAAVIGVFYEIGAHDAFLHKVRTVSRHQLELLREAVHDDMEKNARPRQEGVIRACPATAAAVVGCGRGGPLPQRGRGTRASLRRRCWVLEAAASKMVATALSSARLRAVLHFGCVGSDEDVG
uniref:Uncharacterized protein n=1 Tax=Aegilops tauschii TaxID=37682 RepID=M8BTC0_AEGTA